MHIETVQGQALREHIDDVARLRMLVFEEFPYLYKGSLEYEQRYLQSYVTAESARVVLARDEHEVVGASTVIGLWEAETVFREPFIARGQSVRDVAYFGESVLLPTARGQGVGHRFFDEREAHARTLGCAWTVFCAVERAADHTLRPADYRELHSFWLGRGYERQADLPVSLSWLDVDQPAPTSKRLTFWTRRFG
jgi:GNAT superfamily N-acetyltransferase